MFSQLLDSTTFDQWRNDTRNDNRYKHFDTRQSATQTPLKSQPPSSSPLLRPDFVIEKHRPELRRIDLRRAVRRPVVPSHRVRGPRRRGPPGLLLHRRHLLHFPDEACPGSSPTESGRRRTRRRRREAPPSESEGEPDRDRSGDELGEGGQKTSHIRSYFYV